MQRAPQGGTSQAERGRTGSLDGLGETRARAIRKGGHGGDLGDVGTSMGNRLGRELTSQPVGREPERRARVSTRRRPWRGLIRSIVALANDANPKGIIRNCLKPSRGLHLTRQVQKKAGPIPDLAIMAPERIRPIFFRDPGSLPRRAGPT